METIKVNMNPNPLDVQTIHASQNDGEARQWGFELHNNGDVIDSSEVTDQMVFKAYKGGTEQILPENTSTPTTSPFKGDIKYPQGLLTDQEFTYRQSPTEKDGLAKITDIKGNTLVWNQLVQNGNFADGTNGWTRRYVGTISASNNILTYSYTDSTKIQNWQTEVKTPAINIPANHKVIISYDVKPNGTVGFNKHVANTGSGVVFFDVSPSTIPDGTWTHCTYYGSFEQNITALQLRMAGTSVSSGFTANLKNVQIIDLTKMFGSGNEPSTVEEFTSLFPLSYYSYNQGSLLSFNGNGLKTVGKNLTSVTSGNNQILLNAVKGWDYTIAWDSDGAIGGYNIQLNGTTISVSKRASWCTFTAPDSGSINFNGYGANISTIRNYRVYIGTYTEIPNYEPYTSSTLSLPISTYFPTGMKSAGNVYDELTESKAITRIGAVDLGSLTWEYISEIPIFQATITGGRFTRGQDLPCDMYSNSGYMSSANMPNMTYQILDNGTLWIKNTSYTSATAFKQAMTDQNVKLYYELATPTETSFTTASLVTENAEIPLSNEDGKLIGKCTEKLSENPGFFDAKIKLTDADGECYSNKIQLHVERSPQ